MASRSTQLLPLLLAFVLGVGAAAGLAACGSGSSKALIPAANADQLKSDLDDVASAVDGQDCGRSAVALAQLQRDLQSLPSSTGRSLQRKLQEGYDRLRRQAARECRATTTTTTIPTTTVETTTQTTVPTTTTPTTAPTTPTTPATTSTPTTVPTVPPDTGGVTTP